MEIPKRRLGRTGVTVTILGLGGEGILRTYGYDKDAIHLINTAIDLGINYLESARAYSGSEVYYGKALKDRRKEIFLASKSHARDKEGALSQLHETLKNMGTDHLDLWQVHDVRTEDDIERIFSPDGAIEAFVEAKKNGLTRYIGVTGHHDPSITKRCIELFDFDTVLVPVNPAEPDYKSFIQGVLPLANEKQMGIVGMKVYLRGIVQGLPVRELLRFALTQPVSTAVIGCDTIEQLKENVSIASSFSPMSEEEMKKLTELFSPHARKLMYYKP